MAKKERRTFQEILEQERPRIARELEIKARIASKVAKVCSASALYQLKYRAVRELFKLPGHMPLVRNAWSTDCGILLSIKLCRTDSWLHFPFEQMSGAARQFYGPWVVKRARGNRWQITSRTSPNSAQLPCARSVR